MPDAVMKAGRPHAQRIAANAAIHAALDLDYDWMPWPGRHVLSLQDAQGRELDSVRFEVRGAVERAHAPGKKK